jgi:hypothetical protein
VREIKRVGDRVWRLLGWLVRLLEIVVIAVGLVMFVREGIKGKPDGAVMAAWLGFVSAPVGVRTILHRRGTGSSSTEPGSVSQPPESSSPSTT